MALEPQTQQELIARLFKRNAELHGGAASGGAASGGAMHRHHKKRHNPFDELLQELSAEHDLMTILKQLKKSQVHALYKEHKAKKRLHKAAMHHSLGHGIIGGSASGGSSSGGAAEAEHMVRKRHQRAADKPKRALPMYSAFLQQVNTKGVSAEQRKKMYQDYKAKLKTAVE